jgi:hypothetical protein
MLGLHLKNYNFDYNFVKWEERLVIGGPEVCRELTVRASLSFSYTQPARAVLALKQVSEVPVIPVLQKTVQCAAS